MTNNDDPKKKLGAPHISDMILGSLKPRTGKATGKWIAGLADDAALKDAAEAAAKEMSSTNTETAVATAPAPEKFTSIVFLENLFDNFQQFEYDFNKTFAGTDVTVSIERAAFGHETIKSKLHPAETVQVFRGRLSTRYWTMIVRARPDDIEGWIIPIDQLFAFGADSSTFTPFLRIDSKVKDGDQTWHIDGVEIPWEKMRAFAKMLLGALVMVAKGERGENEPFYLKPKVAQQTTSAPGAMPAPAALDYSFDEHNPDFDSPFINTTGITTSPKAAAPAPQPAAPTVAPSSMDKVLTALNSAIGIELEKLSNAGAAAFANQDLVAVEKTMKRTTKVKELQKRMVSTVEEWKKQLADIMEN